MHERILPNAGQTRNKYDEFRSFEDGVFGSGSRTRPRSGGVKSLVQKIARVLFDHGFDPEGFNKPSRVSPGSGRHEHFPLGPIGGFDE